MSKTKFDITRELKTHEKKYTAILVILFIIAIVFTGYYILSIDNKELSKMDKTINYRYSSISSSSQIITLTDKNKMTDKEALSLPKTTIHIKNTTDSEYDYQIVLKKNKQSQNTSNEAYKYIKYSLDGKVVLKLDKSMVIYKGSLKEDEEKDILINIWLDEKLSIKNYTYYGYFSIEKINQD